MSKPRGIILCGLNGSGKTTLGRELAGLLHWKHMDHEAYHFEESEIPYTVERPYEVCLRLMLADIEKHGSFVLSAVTGDFGDTIPQLYALAVCLSAPHELRMQRIRQRAHDQHGKRVLMGGDMHAQHERFLDFAASRSPSRVEQWTRTLTCPVLHMDGTADPRANAAVIAARLCDQD